MPTAPLPKPAAPVPKKPQGTQAGQVPPVSLTQSSRPANLAVPTPNQVTPVSDSGLTPPKSQLKQSVPQAPTRSNQPVPPVSSGPSIGRPLPTSSNPQPIMQSNKGVVRTTPNRPPIPVARPGSPLPMEPAQPSLGSPLASGAKPQPVAPTPAQQPPRTLSALQSMSSTNLPNTGTPEQAKTTQPAPGVIPAYGTPKAPAAPEAGVATPPPGGKKPELAEPKKSPLRFLPFILGGLVLLGVLGYAAFAFLGVGKPEPISQSPSTTPAQPSESVPVSQKAVIEYWGLWEPTETMAEVIKDYEALNPGVTINYTKQSHVDYRVRLKTALVQGENGPDIFRFHASWVPMMKEELSVLPSGVMTSAEYQSTFYPSAGEMLNVQGNLVGIPLMYEGLALYYNTEIFSTAVVEPPKTWTDLRTIASRLTVKAGNDITRAGIALGNATNVEHFSDVLAVLMMQNKADLLNPNSPETRDALRFYTNFVTADDVWNDTLPLSSVAFARGDVAMIFAPSWRAHEIKQMNPNLPFKVIPLPQLDEERTAYANFWAEGVSSKSDNKEESWKFLKYLSSAEVQKKLYANQSEVRPFGEMYSRKDLANELASDPIVSAFLQDAPYAKGSYMSSYTHDDGLNDQIIKYYEDAVTAIISGTDVEQVLITLDQGVKQTLRQYGVEVPPAGSASKPVGE